MLMEVSRALLNFSRDQIRALLKNRTQSRVSSYGGALPLISPIGFFLRRILYVPNPNVPRIVSGDPTDVSFFRMLLGRFFPNAKSYTVEHPKTLHCAI